MVIEKVENDEDLTRAEGETSWRKCASSIDQENLKENSASISYNFSDTRSMTFLRELSIVDKNIEELTTADIATQNSHKEVETKSITGSIVYFLLSIVMFLLAIAYFILPLISTTFLIIYFHDSEILNDDTKFMGIRNWLLIHTIVEWIILILVIFNFMYFPRDKKPTQIMFKFYAIFLVIQILYATIFMMGVGYRVWATSQHKNHHVVTLVLIQSSIATAGISILALIIFLSCLTWFITNICRC